MQAGMQPNTTYGTARSKTRMYKACIFWLTWKLPPRYI